MSEPGNRGDLQINRPSSVTVTIMSYVAEKRLLNTKQGA